MKKFLSCMMFALVIGLFFNISQTFAAHFDMKEAETIVFGNGGKWVDTNTGKVTQFSPRGGDIIDKGYTDLKGNSKIWLGNRGAPFIMNVTYYPDQDKYYATIIIGDSWEQNVHWKVFSECAYRE